jgi:hypothetical protein
MSVNDFEKVKQLGKGSFGLYILNFLKNLGVTYLVCSIKDKKHYCMKQIPTDDLSVYVIHYIKNINF